MRSQVSQLVRKLLDYRKPMEVILSNAGELLSAGFSNDDFELTFDSDIDSYVLVLGGAAFYYSHEELVADVIHICEAL